MELRAEQNLETWTERAGLRQGCKRVPGAGEAAGLEEYRVHESTLRVGPGSSGEVDSIFALLPFGRLGTQ